VKHDMVRDRVLAREGYATIRFDNGAVDKNIDGVLEIIWEELQRRRHRPLPGAPHGAPTSPGR